MTGYAEGWILDLFMDEPGYMKIWVKKRDGSWFIVRDKWQPHIYAYSLWESLTQLASNLLMNCPDVAVKFEKKTVRLQDHDPSSVLRINYPEPNRLNIIIDFITNFDSSHRIWLYDVDILAEQMYLYEKDLFPLAFVKVKESHGRVEWCLQDTANAIDYVTPSLKILNLEVEAAGTGPLPLMSDTIGRIVLHAGTERIEVVEGDEFYKIQNFVSSLAAIDPDFIVTTNGDSLFPYLMHRARELGISDRLNLTRGGSVPRFNRKGVVFTSYGQVYYRPPANRFPGRIHIDRSSSFLYDECELDGYIELARVCRIPLQTVVHAAIGTVMRSSQLYVAVKKGVLIPWRKREPEDFKTGIELLIADRGGVYCDPKVGVFENVGELDFESLYPRLMVKNNISPETVNCSCCDEPAPRIPEIDYHVCTRRNGLIPEALKTLVDQRDELKEKWRTANSKELKAYYERRRTALKWVLVSCFGYLGYKNAKFGKIDAHIAVCALARATLLKAIEIAENAGFEVIHGMVDSLWVSKPDATIEGFQALQEKIRSETGLKISFEGVYKWIVLLPTKTKDGVGALNKYYGAFSNGELKVRGIAVRRHDTPPIIRECQQAVLQLLSTAQNRRELVQLLPKVKQMIEFYKKRLANGEVQAHELAFTTQITQEIDAYTSTLSHVSAAKHLADMGVGLSPGEQVEYVIINSRSRRFQRKALPLSLVDSRTPYDRHKYIQYLQTAMEIINPIIALTK